MSIEDDVALLERVPTLRLLGTTSLRMLAIGSEQRDFAGGDVLFNAGEDADAGYIVQRGAFRIEDGGGVEIIAGLGALIGELALVVAMPRPSTAIALEHSSVIRVARSLFQRVVKHQKMEPVMVHCPNHQAGNRVRIERTESPFVLPQSEIGNEEATEFPAHPLKKHVR